MIVVGPYGQLGNRLWLFHFIAFSREFGVTVINPSFNEYSRYFVGTKGTVFCKYPRGRFHFLTSRRIQVAVHRLTRLITRTLSRLSFSLPGIDLVTLNDGDALSLRDPTFVERARSARLLLVRGWLYRDRTRVIRTR